MRIVQFFELSSVYTWAFQAFAILVIALGICAIEAFIHRRILPKLERSNHFWQLAFVKTAHSPFRVLVWFLGVVLSLQVATDQVSGILISFRKMGVGLIFVWFLVRMVKQFEQNLLEHRSKRGHLDETSVKAIGQLFRTSIFLTAVLIVLQAFGVPISGVVAFGGISAAAIGFAAKDLLANFFGAFMIYLDRPFSIGEWIRLPDQGVEGVVEDIGWRLTRVRTFDLRPLYVPNGIFSNVTIENPSRMHNRRIKTLLGVRYSDAQQVLNITASLKEMAQNHPEIDTKQSIRVNLIEFGPSSLDIEIYMFTKTTNKAHFQDVQEDILLKSMAIVDAHGAEMAYPTQTIIHKKI
ncbi:MAG: mechanosensitive ion channel family protein [Chlamydiales bacterium]|nr:mechanosensitive ion channel family protein [Chlamydiales bacterium]